MKLKKQDLKDIYRTQEPETAPSSPAKLAQAIQKSLRRQTFFNVLIGALTLLLLLTLIFLLIKNYLLPDLKKPLRVLQYAPVYTLPPEDRWVLDFRQAATDLEGVHLPDVSPVSVRWIRHAAYHIVSGEMALNTQDPAQAQIHFENALRIFPELQGVHGALGRALLEQGKFQDAAEHLERALLEEESDDVLVNLGVALIHQGHYDRAGEVFERALELYPGLTGVHKNLALLHRETGLMDRVVSHFEAYFSETTDDLDAARIYTDYLTRSGKFQDALRFLDRIQTPENLPARLLLASTAAKAGDGPRAVAALHDAARLLSPRLLLVEINRNAFDPIRQTEAFQTLVRRLELASVSLSHELDPPDGEKIPENKDRD